MDRPNVLLITIDCLRSDMLGRRLGEDRLTPNLDRLAASGIRFRQAISGGSWTQAAFPVILTSTYPAMYGGCLGRLASERPSPIEALAAQGYMTGGFSTNPHVSQATGYDRGFDHFEDLVPDESGPALHKLKGGQRLLRLPITHYVSRTFGKRWRPARVYNSAAEVTDRLGRWLEGVSRPFFAWAHYMDVHWPYHLEESLQDPAEIAKAWRELSIMYRAGRLNQPMTIAEQKRIFSLYEEALAYLDAQIGRLIRRLVELKHNTDTIVIITADHGEEFLEHDRWGHKEANLHDEILRVPLIVNIPGQSSGRIIDRQVRLLDLMPTILDLCGCSSVADLEGVSIAPLWEKNEDNYETAVSISEMQRPPLHRVAVRTNELKYIWDNRHPEQPEMYDLRADPEEKRNIAHHRPVDVAYFQDEVDVHLRRVDETQPALMSPDIEFDRATVRRLRDLGYID